MNKRRGFTLVELMVVIAILALLLMALMPTFGQVRIVARNMRCQNNLHNISVGMADTRANSTGSSVLMFPDASLYPSQFPGTKIDLSNYLCEEDVNATQILPTADPNYASVSSSGTNAVNNQTIANPRNDPTSPANGLQFGSSMGGGGPVKFAAFSPGFHCVARRGTDGGRGYWEYCIEDSFERQATWTGAMNDGIWRVYDPAPGSKNLDFVLVYSTCSWKNAIFLNGTNILQGPFNACQYNLKRDTVRRPGDQSQYDNIITQWKAISPPATLTLAAIPTNYGVNENLKNFTPVSETIAIMDYDVLRGGGLIYVNDKTKVANTFNAILSASKRHNGSVNALLSNGSVRQYGPNELNPTLTGSNNATIHRLWGRSSTNWPN